MYLVAVVRHFVYRISFLLLKSYSVKHVNMTTSLTSKVIFFVVPKALDFSLFGDESKTLRNSCNKRTLDQTGFPSETKNNE